MFKALLYREMCNFNRENESNKGPLGVILIFLSIYIALVKFSGMPAGIMYSYIMLTSVISAGFAKEREVAALSYLTVTPASRYKYIGVKFILLIGLFAMLLVLNSFTLFISNKVGIDPKGLTYTMIAIVMLAIVAMASIYIPLPIKFGPNIAIFSNLIIAFIVIGAAGLIFSLLEDGKLIWLVNILSGIGEDSFKIIVVVFLVLILFINYLLSVKFSKYPKN